MVERYTFRLGHDPEYDAPCVEKVPTISAGPRAFVSHTDYAALEAANTRLTKELADLKASFDANVNEMSQRFRSVNIAEVIKQSGVDFVKLSERLAASEARVAELEKALKPFAKAGELFPDPQPEFDQYVYNPAAGEEYSLGGNHLRAARSALTPAKENADAE